MTSVSRPNNGAGGPDDGYLKFFNVSRFLKPPKDSLTVRAGQFELDLPVEMVHNSPTAP